MSFISSHRHVYESISPTIRAKEDCILCAAKKDVQINRITSIFLKLVRHLYYLQRNTHTRAFIASSLQRELRATVAMQDIQSHTRGFKGSKRHGCASKMARFFKQNSDLQS